MFLLLKHLDHLLFYGCGTDCGSSGAPVFKVVNGQIQLIALHRGRWVGNRLKFGTLITKVLDHVKYDGPPAREYDQVFT